MFVAGLSQPEGPHNDNVETQVMNMEAPAAAYTYAALTEEVAETPETPLEHPDKTETPLEPPNKTETPLEPPNKVHTSMKAFGGRDPKHLNHSIVDHKGL